MATVSDNFNRADGALGSNWTPMTTDAPVIATNAATGVTTNAQHFAYWNANGFANDLIVTITTSTNAALGGYQGPVARASGSGGTADCYMVTASTFNDTWTLYRMDDGAFTVLQDSTAAIAPGDTIGLQVAGDQITALWNGSPFSTAVTDATYTSGAAGLQCYSGVGVQAVDAWESTGADISKGLLALAGLAARLVTQINMPDEL